MKADLMAAMIDSPALTGWAKSPQMKMTTEIPQGIAMPDTVKTRLGTLNFFDGFPDKPTVEKFYDNQKILTEAAAVGDATARALTYQSRIPEAFYYPNSTWRQWLGGYQFQKQPGVAYLDAAAFFYFYATGVSRPWKPRWWAKAPVKDFWSAIVYDNQTRSMLQTDQDFPQVSSLDKGLVVNKDGSVDVYFGPKAPAGMETIWNQTIPGKGWNMLFRLYGPLDPWFDKTWKLSEIEKIQ